MANQKTNNTICSATPMRIIHDDRTCRQTIEARNKSIQNILSDLREVT